MQKPKLFCDTSPVFITEDLSDWNLSMNEAEFYRFTYPVNKHH